MARLSPSTSINSKIYLHDGNKNSKIDPASRAKIGGFSNNADFFLAMTVEKTAMPVGKVRTIKILFFSTYVFMP